MCYICDRGDLSREGHNVELDHLLEEYHRLKGSDDRAAIDRCLRLIGQVATCPKRRDTSRAVGPPLT